MERQNGGLIPAAAAVLLWSTIATAYKLSLRALAPLPLLCWAATVSFLLLCLLRILSGGRTILPSCTPRELAASALLGLLNPFLYYLLLLQAYARLLAQTALVLNYTWPLFMALLAVPILRRRLRRRSLAALLASFAGVLIIVTRGQPGGIRLTDTAGTILAVGSAVCWALYWLLNMRDRRAVIDKLCLNFLFGTVYAWLAAAVSRQILLPSALGLAGAAWLGVFEMGLTFLLWLRALEATRSPAMLGNIAYLVPFVALIPLRFILGERLLASTFWGAGLIVAGILLQGLGRGARASTDAGARASTDAGARAGGAAVPPAGSKTGPGSG
jgi:drug/metabolite transporter (DMT)-like permease